MSSKASHSSVRKCLAGGDRERKGETLPFMGRLKSVQVPRLLPEMSEEDGACPPRPLAFAQC